MALALSRWVVCGYAELLFIWVALGVGFGTLPGQLYFVSEALFAILLFWPIMRLLRTFGDSGELKQNCHWRVAGGKLENPC
jgi:hypothetical protein